MDPKANTFNSNNTLQSNTPNKHKVHPLIIKKIDFSQNKMYLILRPQTPTMNSDHHEKRLKNTIRQSKVNSSQHQIVIHH